MRSGVYRIDCFGDNKVYIGSAKNIPDRWRCHLKDLRNNEHANSPLQNAWNKYGIEGFVFSVVEECELLDLIRREQFWMDKFQVTNKVKGFNIKPLAGSNLGAVLSPETRAKISLARKGKPLSLEHKIKIGEAGKLWKHLPCSVETKQKISIANSGRICTAEHRQKLSAARLGKVQTEQHNFNAASTHCKIGREDILSMLNCLYEGVSIKNISKKFKYTAKTIRRMLDTNSFSYGRIISNDAGLSLAKQRVMNAT